MDFITVLSKTDWIMKIYNWNIVPYNQQESKYTGTLKPHSLSSLHKDNNCSKIISNANKMW